jgi:hypothetical protein
MHSGSWRLSPSDISLQRMIGKWILFMTNGGDLLRSFLLCKRPYMSFRFILRIPDFTMLFMLDRVVVKNMMLSHYWSRLIWGIYGTELSLGLTVGFLEFGGVIQSIQSVWICILQELFVNILLLGLIHLECLLFLARTTHVWILHSGINYLRKVSLSLYFLSPTQLRWSVCLLNNSLLSSQLA